MKGKQCFNNGSIEKKKILAKALICVSKERAHQKLV